MSTDLAKVPATWFTMGIFHLNAMLDGANRFDIDEVHREAEARRLTYLLTSDRFPDEPGIFNYLGETGKEDARAALDELFEGLSLAVDSRRKFGVEQNGIALVLAYFTEALQQWMELKGVRP